MKKPTKKLKKSLLRRLILVLLGVILGVNTYLANATTIVGNKLPMPFGYGAATVLSGSMEPTLSVGDLIIVRATDNASVGEVVVYQVDNSLVVHRVTAVEGDSITAQGDANNTPDPSFDRSAIKGVVVGCIPNMGSVVSALRTPMGTLVVLLGAFVLVELSFRKQKDKDNAELEAIKEEIRRLRAERDAEGEQNEP